MRFKRGRGLAPPTSMAILPPIISSFLIRLYGIPNGTEGTIWSNGNTCDHMGTKYKASTVN